MVGLHRGVHTLIRAGATLELRSNGFTALHFAADFSGKEDKGECLHGKLKCIEVLVKAGADVNATMPGSDKIVAGGTALLVACESAEPKAIELLLQCKADPLVQASDGQNCYSVIARATADVGAKQACERLLRKAEREAEDERSFFGRKNSVRAICEMAQMLAATDKHEKSPNGASAAHALTPRTDDARKEAKQKERHWRESAQRSLSNLVCSQLAAAL